MRLHERHRIVTSAHSDAAVAIMRIFNEADLSYGEVIAFHAHELSTNAKYMIREERHGDADKPGDEA